LIKKKITKLIHHLLVARQRKNNKKNGMEKTTHTHTHKKKTQFCGESQKKTKTKKNPNCLHPNIFFLLFLPFSLPFSTRQKKKKKPPRFF